MLSCALPKLNITCARSVSLHPEPHGFFSGDTAMARRRKERERGGGVKVLLYPSWDVFGMTLG